MDARSEQSGTGRGAPQYAGGHHLPRKPFGVEFARGPVVALIVRQVHKAPEDAIGWAKSVTEPALNKKTHTNLANDWLRKDPAAATM